MKCNFNFLFSRLPGGVQLLLLQDPLLGLPAALLLLVLPTSLLQFSVLRLQVLFHLLVTPLELRGHGGTAERLTERQPERKNTLGGRRGAKEEDSLTSTSESRSFCSFSLTFISNTCSISCSIFLILDTWSRRSSSIWARGLLETQASHHTVVGGWPLGHRDPPPSYLEKKQDEGRRKGTGLHACLVCLFVEKRVYGKCNVHLEDAPKKLMPP